MLVKPLLRARGMNTFSSISITQPVILSINDCFAELVPTRQGPFQWIRTGQGKWSLVQSVANNCSSLWNALFLWLVVEVCRPVCRGPRLQPSFRWAWSPQALMCGGPSGVSAHSFNDPEESANDLIRRRLQRDSRRSTGSAARSANAHNDRSTKAGQVTVSSRIRDVRGRGQAANRQSMQDSDSVAEVASPSRAFRRAVRTPSSITG